MSAIFWPAGGPSETHTIQKSAEGHMGSGSTIKIGTEDIPIPMEDIRTAEKNPTVTCTESDANPSW